MYGEVTSSGQEYLTSDQGTGLVYSDHADYGGHNGWGVGNKRVSFADMVVDPDSLTPEIPSQYSDIPISSYGENTYEDDPNQQYASGPGVFKGPITFEEPQGLVTYPDHHVNHQYHVSDLSSTGKCHFHFLIISVSFYKNVISHLS